jgi:hypothetical protein
VGTFAHSLSVLTEEDFHAYTAAFERTGFSHAMRNELVEELIVEGEAKVMRNRTGSPQDPAKAARGRANQTAERKK